MSIIRLMVAAIMIWAGIACSGCESRPKEAGSDGQLQLVAPAKQQMLIEGTARLLTDVYVQVVAASGEAAAATTDRAIQEESLRWRIVWINKLDAIRPIEDPRLQFIAAWTLIDQLRMSLTTLSGQPRFGPVQGIYDKAITDLEQKVLAVAHDVFPPDVVNAAKPAIHQIATSPKTAAAPSPKAIAANQTIASILSIPMAPVSGLRGVGDTPAAINRFTDQAAEFARIVERFPERSRWQMELMLLEAEESGAMSRALKNADKAVAEVESLRKEFSKIAATIQSLPDRAQAMLEEILKSEPALARDLDRIEASLKLANQAVQQGDRTVASVNLAIDNARMALAEVDRSAQAIRSATVEVRALVSDFKKEPASPPATEPAGPTSDGFDPGKIQAMAGEIQAASRELRKLLDDLRAPAPLAGLDRTAQQIERVIIRSTWCLGTLIVVFFGAALLYRRCKGGAQPTHQQPKPT